MKCTVKIIWDDEASVWYSSSDEIPLSFSEESYDTLIERVRLAASEVMEECRGYTGPLYLVFESVRIEKPLVY